MNAKALALRHVLFVTFMLVGCGGEPDTPEGQIRAAIQRGAEAAERKDLKTLRDLMSDGYRDDHQLDKRGAEGLLRLHFLRNKSIHLLVRTADVTVTDPDHGAATVLVAMAGVPIPTVEDLPVLRADLHHFELSFTREEKNWRVTQATWRRAEPAEFLIR
jgi:hypothetical protein